MVVIDELLPSCNHNDVTVIDTNYTVVGAHVTSDDCA